MIRSPRLTGIRICTSSSPTAGSETGDPLEFLVRELRHFPDNSHVTTRYSGWHANRAPGMS